MPVCAHCKAPVLGDHGELTDHATDCVFEYIFGTRAPAVPVKPLLPLMYRDDPPGAPDDDDTPPELLPG